MTKFVSWFFKIILLIVILFNLYILISGNIYIYKALVYNYVEIDNYKIFENRTIETKNPIPLNNHIKYNKYTLSEADELYHQKYKSVAFLAIQNDSILHEAYWNGYSKESLSNSFSMAKSVIGILVGIAIDEGKIHSENDLVGNYLPQFLKGNSKNLTIKHLLQMGADLNFDESYSDLFSQTTEIYYGSNLTDFVSQLEVRNEPGVYFNYQSSNQIILAMILEKVTGMKISHYMSHKLWKPIHAEYNANWSLDYKEGLEKAYCCINSNARDFAKLGLLYLNNGKYYNKQIISKKWIDKSTSPSNLIDEKGQKCNFYGYSWWLTEMDHQNVKHKVYYMRGILGQYVFVIPDYNLVIVRLGQERSNNKIGEHPEDIYRYMGMILNTYFK